jgi:hypothetical protein
MGGADAISGLARDRVSDTHHCATERDVMGIAIKSEKTPI